MWLNLSGIKSRAWETKDLTISNWRKTSFASTAKSCNHLRQRIHSRRGIRVRGDYWGFNLPNKLWISSASLMGYLTWSTGSGTKATVTMDWSFMSRMATNQSRSNSLCAFGDYSAVKAKMYFENKVVMAIGDEGSPSGDRKSRHLRSAISP